MTDFSSDQLQIINSLIAEEQARQALYRVQSLEEFHNTLLAAVAANANGIDVASASVGDGDSGLVAIAVEIGAPLSGYSVADWPVLKGWLWDQLYNIRAQRLGP